MSTQPSDTDTDKDSDKEQNPTWGKPARRQHRLPGALAMVAALAIYSVLPVRLRVGLQPPLIFIIPGLVCVVIVALMIAAPVHRQDEPRWQRVASLGVIAVVSIIEVTTLLLLVNALAQGSRALRTLHLDGPPLLLAAIAIWLTNVLVFASWYWELDRGGPSARCAPHHRRPDFLFQQMQTPDATDEDWAPSYMDYLYVSFTNSTALSPTDTMPMTGWAKALMLIQALASLVTVALVVSRAVSILQ